MDIYNKETVPHENVPSDSYIVRSLSSGAILGDYKIISQIGEGGMGTVYKAYQQSLQRHVALKALKQSFASTPQNITRLKNEAISVAQLRHPNIIQVYGIGNEQGIHFFVMELVCGKALDELIKEKKRSLIRGRYFFSVYDSLQMILQVAEGLHYAHEAGIIHRDIKPANIIQDEKTNRLMIADFGLARPLFIDKNQPKEDFAGTPIYVAPEVFFKGTWTIKADIYSFGATFYELLTSEKLYKAKTIKQLISKVKKGDYTPPHKINKEIPKEISSALRKCLEPSPAHRYSSIMDFIDDLRLFLNDGRTRAHDQYSRFSSDKKRIKKDPFIRRVKIKALILLIGIFALSGITTGSRIYKEWWKIHFTTDEYCRQQLEIAHNYYQLNRSAFSLPILKKIIEKYPDTKYARQAEEMIKKIEEKELTTNSLVLSE